MSLFEEYQLFRRILCLCPCCNQLVRVSDLRLKAKGPAPKTWLDEYQLRDQALAKREVTFEEQEEKLREEAHEKGRKEAEKAFYKAICPSLQKLKLNPFDVKPIFHPIDFVVFNGMSSPEKIISDIKLLTREHNCPSVTPIRDQIKKAVAQYKYDWQVARIEETGSIVLE
jgi:predicted Holliday junction resolvase-like endonuclease